MKSIILFAIILILSCNESKESLGPERTISEDEKVIRFTHRSLAFELKNDQLNCRLSYAVVNKEKSEEFVKHLDLEPPCEVVRNPATLKPLIYSYTKPQNFDVMIIVGGPPNKDRKDKLMPSGCGTEFQPVSISENDIKIAEKIGQERKIFIGCPSEGMDEIYFAYYANP